MKMEWSLACAGNDWLKARGRERERLFSGGEAATAQKPFSVFKQTLFLQHRPFAL